VIERRTALLAGTANSTHSSNISPRYGSNAIFCVKSSGAEGRTDVDLRSGQSAKALPEPA
jgi:hypothetical protein